MEKLSPALNTILEYLQAEKNKKRFDDILGAKAPAFIVSVMQTIKGNPELHNADLESIANAAIEIALLGLPLSSNLQYAHITALQDKGVTYAQCHIGWRGLVQLAQRTEKFKTINVAAVKDGELKNNDLLSGILTFEREQDEAKRKTLKTVGWVSFFELLSGFQKSIYKTVEDLEEHGKKYSRDYKTSNWASKDTFDIMAAKTVIKNLLSNWAPLSDHIEIARAIKADQAVITGEGQYMYPDNPQAESKPEKPRGRVKAANTIEHVNKLLEAGKIKKANTKKK